jgi:Zn-dependent M16 (insulinase) family peptidase
MEKDESIGEVQISWLGYSPTDNLAGMAIGILGSYLADSTASPLQKAFVDIPEPLATSIGIYTSDRATKAEMTLYISDVPAEELETIGDKVKGVLKDIVDNNAIDMERIGLVLRRDKRKMLNAMETSATDVLADCVVNGMLTLLLDLGTDRL